MAIATKLFKGCYAIAHVQKSGNNLLTGRYQWNRFYIVKVVSASKDGEVKTFTKSRQLAAERNDRLTTIYSIPEQYLDSARTLHDLQEACFVGYIDKDHLRLCLVNQSIKEAA